MSYRQECGENITQESWILRNIWDRNKGAKRKPGIINKPRKLQVQGVKRIMETALWTQGLRHKLDPGKRRHEFQADHGFRKLFKTRCELAGMMPINIEILMGHSVGISDSYYRATEKEILDDYLKAIDFLTITKEQELNKKVNLLITDHSNKEKEIKAQLFNRERENSSLTEVNSSNSDAIAALSEKVMDLTKEIEGLKARLHK